MRVKASVWMVTLFMMGVMGCERDNDRPRGGSGNNPPPPPPPPPQESYVRFKLEGSLVRLSRFEGFIYQNQLSLYGSGRREGQNDSIYFDITAQVPRVQKDTVVSVISNLSWHASSPHWHYRSDNAGSMTVRLTYEREQYVSGTFQGKVFRVSHSDAGPQEMTITEGEFFLLLQ
ncbi:MAG: hypothetical protein N2253_07670 [Bacteroidia bacterium]|nr:hypothetical protein [Bacteroidia bacterium]MCX7764751.1 hypothetical protein [Bacteroidia bacterium]MDW8058321.1 hypothetical protein [Bacteroidia bacterium]